MYSLPINLLAHFLFHSFFVADRHLDRQAPHLVRLSEHITGHALAPSSARGYGYEERRFERWAEHYGVPAYPATVHTLDLYLSDLAASTESDGATVKAASAIAAKHRRLGFIPPNSHPKIGELIKGVKRLYGRPYKQATPLEASDVARMVRRLLSGNPTPVQWRTAWSSLIAFQAASRVGDLSKLRVRNIVFLRDGSLQLQFPCLKNIPNTRGFTCSIAADRGSDLCPVSVTERYLAALSLRGDHFVLPQIASLRSGAFSVRPSSTASAQALLRAIRSALSDIGMPGHEFGQHSFRRGAAIALREAGHEDSTINDRVGWRSSEMLSRYTRDSQTRQSGASRSLHLQ